MAEAKIIISAKDEASQKISGVSNNLKALGVAAGAAFVTLGVFAVKEAAKFQKAMASISTLIEKDVTKQIATLDKGIKDLMKSIPVTGEDLGVSAYNILSAGITDANDALIVLKQSAMLAVSGLGTTAEATDLMTSALNAFQIPASQAAEVADTLFKTVKFGKTTVEELAIGFGKVAPVAKSMGISLEELQAATAAVTTSGIAASEVQTGLKAIMANLIKPTTELSDIFDQLNVKTGKELIETSGGLVNALQKVKDIAVLNGLEFGEVMSSVEGLTIAESLLGAQNSIFTDSLLAMTEGSNSLDEAFKKQTETFDAQWQILKNQLTVIMINLGSIILPMLTTAIGKLSVWMKENEDVVNILSSTLGIILKAAILVISSLIEGLVLFIRTLSEIFSDFRDLFILGWEKIKQFAGPIIDGLSSAISALASGVTAVINAFKKAKDLAGSVVGKVTSVFKAQGGFVEPVYAANGFASRGRDTVPAMLTPGELVLNAAQQKNLSQKLSGTTINITVNGDVTGQDLIDRVGDALAKKMFNHSAIV